MEYPKIIHLIDIRTTAELRKSQKIHNKIIQKQLQMRMIKKYLKKDINLQKKAKNY